jgi:hypothetical protein
MVLQHDDAWFVRAFESAYASAASSKSYIARMHAALSFLQQCPRLAKKPKRFLDVLSSPDTFWPIFRDGYVLPNGKEKKLTIGSRRAICTLALAALKLLPECAKEALAAPHERWRSLQKTTALLHESERREGRLTDHERKRWVSLAEIRERVTELSHTDWNATRKSSQQFVLLSVYATTPPPRSDLGNVRVYHRDPGVKDANYLVLTPHDSFFAFNVYKTAKKRNQRVVSELTPGTARAIRESLRLHPREFLFVDRYGRPYTKNSSYGTFVQNTFAEHFQGRGAGPSLLRHVFITDSGIFDGDTPPELREGAHERMMHSAGTALTYRKRLSAKGPELCVCTEAPNED